MGPHGISVQFIVDLYRRDRFVTAKNHTVKTYNYSSIDYVLDFDLSISVSSYFSRTRDCNILFSLPNTKMTGNQTKQINN